MTKVKISLEAGGLDSGVDLSNLNYRVRRLADGTKQIEIEVDNDQLTKLFSDIKPSVDMTSELSKLYSAIEKSDGSNSKELRKCYNEILTKYKSNGE